MVAPFSNDTAFRQLRDGGVVVTFRAGQWAHTGEDWANRGRGTEKAFDVVVSEIGAVSPTRGKLAPYVEYSGFASVRAWQDAIAELHGAAESGYLYLVERADRDVLTEAERQVLVTGPTPEEL